MASPKDQQQNLLHRGTGANGAGPTCIYERGPFPNCCFPAGIPSSSCVGVLCQQQEGRLLPQRQHPCQIQVLRYRHTHTNGSLAALWSDRRSSSRKLPVGHIRRRGAPHLPQPRRGLRDEHALRSLQRSAAPARSRPGRSPPTPAHSAFSSQASCTAP